MNTDNLSFDPQHIARVQRSLAEQGYELTPEELPDEINRVIGKIQAAMKERGWDATKEEIRNFMLVNRDELFRRKTFVCSDCGKTFPLDPKDPGSGGICLDCATKALDELPELTEAERKAMESFDIKKLLAKFKDPP